MPMVREIDADGFFLRDVFLPYSVEPGANHVTAPLGGSFFRARFDRAKGRWVEGAEAQRIETQRLTKLAKIRELQDFHSRAAIKYGGAWRYPKSPGDDPDLLEFGIDLDTAEGLKQLLGAMRKRGGRFTEETIDGTNTQAQIYDKQNWPVMVTPDVLRELVERIEDHTREVHVFASNLRAEVVDADDPAEIDIDTGWP